eukprot:9371069-Pyramimonas_sp.AAC.1
MGSLSTEWNASVLCARNVERGEGGGSELGESLELHFLSCHFGALVRADKEVVVEASAGDDELSPVASDPKMAVKSLSARSNNSVAAHERDGDSFAWGSAVEAHASQVHSCSSEPRSEGMLQLVLADVDGKSAPPGTDVSRPIPISDVGDVQAGNLGFGDGERGLDLFDRLVERLASGFGVGHPAFEVGDVVFTGVLFSGNYSSNALD